MPSSAEPSELPVRAAPMLLVCESENPYCWNKLFWKRFTTRGAVCGLGTGLLASILLIIIGPSIMGVDAPGATAAAHLIQSPPIFPLENPGLISIPLGFVGAIVGTLLGREPMAEAKYAELLVRASTGLGAEKASAPTAP